jgi:Tol biopolymer transport system component
MKHKVIVVAVLGMAIGVIAAAPPSVAQFPGRPGRFVSRANGLTSYARDGSGAKKLNLGTKLQGKHVEYPSFTPSGKAIVFDGPSEAADTEIFRVKAGGGTARQLTRNTTLDWGPDQGPSRIVFVCVRASGDEICTMKLDGTGLKRLTKNDADDWNPKWSPDGSRIVFSSDRRGSHDIFSMKANGTGVRRLTDDPAGEFEPDVSPNGARIVFWSDATNPGRLVTIRSDGTGWNVLAVDSPYPGDPRTPVWSPNGKRIAFGVADQIWTRQPNDDTSAIKIAVTSGSVDNIGWQPIP